jgi:hypothetical protein
MKNLFLFIIVATCVAGCKKSGMGMQDPTPAASKGVYVAGYENNVAKYWKDGKSILLSDSVNLTTAGATCITVAGNDVYVGGYEINTGPNPVANLVRIAKYWKNGVSVNLTDPASYTNAPGINAITVSGTDVYAAGYERSTASGNLIEVAKYWKNGTPVNLTGSTANSRDAQINSIAVVGNDLYAAGYEYVLRAGSSGTYAVLVAKYWKNGIDIHLNHTDGLTDTYANSVAVAGNDVYVSGYAIPTSGKKIAKYWVNNTSVNLTDSLLYEAEATSIAVIGSDVYVAGYEKNSSGIKIAKYWKNQTAVALTDGTKNAAASTITVSGSDVYVACYEGYAAKYWKNGTAVNLSDGLKLSSATGIVIVP